MKGMQINKNIIFLRSTSIKNDSRVLKEVGCLIKHGYNVKVLGWDRDEFLKNNQSINFDNINIPIQVFRKKAEYGSGIKNLIKLFQFQVWLLYNLLKIRKNIDIIHSCDLDTALPARLISKFFKKKMVYDIFDYYIDSHYMPNKMKKIVENTEINIINKADLTIICTEERREQIKKARPKKCIVIYNTPKIDRNNIKQKLIKSSNDKLKIVYVGILQENRLLKEIGEEIKKYPDFELHIGGFGQLQKYFSKLSEKYGNIFYYGQMKYEDVLNLEEDANLLFATYNPEISNHKYSAPNKLYEAMALGKPIIVCKNTGIDELVKNENIGISISYDAKKFIEVIENLSENKELQKKLSDNAKRLYNEKYSWEQMEKRLIEEYEKID